MAQDALSDLIRMAESAGVVVAVAVPVGLAAVALVRWHIFPGWVRGITPVNRWGLATEAFDFLSVLAFVLLLSATYPLLLWIGWNGLELAGFFDRLYGPLDPARTAQAHQIGGVVVAAPVLAGVWLLYRGMIAGGPAVLSPHRLARDVAFGVVGWVVLTPSVFLVHFFANVLSEWLGAPPDEHGLTTLGVGPSLLSQVVFGAAVCLFTPLTEEILFRGLLVGWAGGRWYRPWVLMLLAAGFALLGTLAGSHGFAPLGFVAVLAAGLLGIPAVQRVRPRFPVRTATTVLATAALFAAAHSAVWPTPVPLFVLGLGLGYLAARSNGVTASTVAHGLFNAVSFVYLLRGPAG